MAFTVPRPFPQCKAGDWMPAREARKRLRCSAADLSTWMITRLRWRQVGLRLLIRRADVEALAAKLGK